MASCEITREYRLVSIPRIIPNYWTRILATTLILSVSLASCEQGKQENQIVSLTLPNFAVQAAVDPNFASISWTLTVDGSEPLLTPTSITVNNNGSKNYEIPVSSNITHHFKLEIDATLTNTDPVKKYTVASSEKDQFIVSKEVAAEHPELKLNNVNLDAFDFQRYNDDDDLMSNWDEIQQNADPGMQNEQPMSQTYALNTARGNDSGYGITATKKGGYVVVGATDTTTGVDMAFWKFNAAGGKDIFQTHAASNQGTDVAYDVKASDGLGGWIAVGKTWNGSNYEMATWEFTASGNLAPNFNGGKILVDDNAAGGNGSDSAQAIAASPDGGWLVAGYSVNGNKHEDMVVWKFTDSGTFAASFNKYAIFVGSKSGANLDDRANAIAVTSDGGWVVVGRSSDNVKNDMKIWKFDSNGLLDSKFDGDGIFTDDGSASGSDNDEALGVVALPDGGWVVTGYAMVNNNQDMALWKFNNTGLDASFNTSGLFTNNNAAGGNSDDVGNRLVVDSLGNFTVVGSSKNATDNDLAIWRVKATGRLDTKFFSGGIYTRNNISGGSGNINDIGTAIAVLNNGSIAVTGYTEVTAASYDMFVLK